MMHSLRGKLVLSTTISAAVVLTATGLLLYLLVHDGLVRQFDRALLDKARLLASAVEWEHGKLDLEFDELDMHEFVTSDQTAYLQIWANDGSVVFRSPQLGTADLSHTARTDEPFDIGWTHLPDGRRGRSVQFTFSPRQEKKSDDGNSHDNDDNAHDNDDDTHDDDSDAVDLKSDTQFDHLTSGLALVMARNTTALDETFQNLKALLLALGLIAVVVTGGALWLAINRSLKPIDRLAAHIDQIEAPELSQPITGIEVPNELRVVVDCLNNLLNRLASAFQRERTFSADVAHELRTPLTGLRSTIDVSLTRLRTTEEYGDVLNRCLRITTQLQAMVEQLLSLARLDAGQVQVQYGSVRVDDLVQEVWETFSEAAETRNLHIEWFLAGDTVIHSDTRLIEIITRNLLQNAVMHTNEGGTITIQTANNENNTEIRVVNTGSQISQEQANQVFERFWRGDAARSATDLHSGLGLSLVQKASATLGGHVHVQTDAEGTFQIDVTIPNRLSSCESDTNLT